ncbi:DUF4157 domain-containing protein [Miltoncostaea marina]|uniref:eCIS core domain-containing protein n=1 Tax=Miltoncostaea marina TaxID=2843215 RepID=UPI001C3D69BC|nr:DUF4157 domain-containing protein [Miltoncostaea marina]
MALRPREEERQAAEARAPAGPTAGPADEVAHPALRSAAALGNQAMTALARAGAGILPGGRVHPDVEAGIAAARGAGRPLDGATRDRMAARLGDGLGDVRVHEGPEAAGLAHAVSARAFTVGADVFFAPGEHRPGTRDGDRLLAHELTHVAQQRGGPANGPMAVSEPGDPAEREADAVADGLAG